MLFGAKAQNKGYIYKLILKNVFNINPTKIPNGYKQIYYLNNDYIKNNICTYFNIIDNDHLINKNIHKGTKIYLTHDNGARPFLFSIKNNIV